MCRKLAWIQRWPKDVTVVLRVHPVGSKLNLSLALKYEAPEAQYLLRDEVSVLNFTIRQNFRFLALYFG